MALDPDFPVPITVLGAGKGGTTLFRQGGKLHLTCVLKASFQFVQSAAMKQLTAQDLFRKEVNRYNNPCLSIVASNELVPYLPRVDVVMTGRACAPAGRTVPRMNVRLAIYHGIALLDKTVHVYGDHNGKEFVPFERMPLEYERSQGGPGHLENPYGTGHLPGSPLPNLMAPRDPSAVAGFGPIAQRLAGRASLLGQMNVSALNQPIPEFPENFDWLYFQAAPRDQQVASIVGNEWIVLEGVHPELTRISSRLPSLRPIATIFGTNPDDPEQARTLQLRLDMLRIDADALRCCVVARGVLQLENERALSTLRVAGAMETEDISFAAVLTPPTTTKSSGAATKAAATLRINEQIRTMPMVKPSESADSPTLRRGGPGLPALSPTGTLALDQDVKPAAPAIVVPIIEAPSSLSATLDTYDVDLLVESVRAPAPPEPAWLDAADLEEVYSVDPLSNPASIRGAMQAADKP
jgi:hypothetical protein